MLIIHKTASNAAGQSAKNHAEIFFINGINTGIIIRRGAGFDFHGRRYFRNRNFLTAFLENLNL
jgi:hypothetical protein